MRSVEACEDAYGIKDLGPAVQILGHVIIREDRAISFPNVECLSSTNWCQAKCYQVFQTKINPFKLCDRSKPGHLKLFVFHLVDPNRRIMSTSMVPCQRRDWWAREIRQLVPVLRRLPVEIFDGIIDVSPCISLKTYAYLTAKLTAITDRRWFPHLGRWCWENQIRLFTGESGIVGDLLLVLLHLTDPWYDLKHPESYGGNALTQVRPDDRSQTARG